MVSHLLSYTLWLFASLVAAVVTRPVVVESLDQLPAGWEEAGFPAPHKLIKLSVGLKPEDDQLLERTLYEISDPSHSSYGKHLSREAAKALLDPPKPAGQAVKRWLSDAGVPANHVQDDGQWLHVRTTVSQAESLLTTRFGVYARNHERVVRTREYSVPIHVRDLITAIQPTTFFHHSLAKSGEMKPPTENFHLQGANQERAYLDVDLCKRELTPACLRKLYKMPENGYRAPHKRALYGIVGFNEQAAQYDQLAEFLRRFDPSQRGRNFSTSLVNGGQNPQGEYPSGEANLNIQWAVSLAGKVPVRFLSVGGENHDFIPDLDLHNTKEAWIEPFLELTTYLLGLDDDKLPQVISISYSVNEQHVPKAYAQQVCNMFGQLGARGVSVVVAAGNRGPGQSCMSNDGKNTTKFLPNFPPSCPYVTSVGGTEGYGREVAFNVSSGGFSEYWPRPPWQDISVKTYLEKFGNEWDGYYNPRGRAFPDVAALAWGHQIMNHDAQQTTGGTSAASPVFGSMIALINNERLSRGKPPMGFLNPWIYKVGREAFKDITEGRSVGCQGTSVWGLPSPVVSNAGWKAAEGWDPVTGWGSPLFDRLERLAMCV